MAASTSTSTPASTSAALRGVADGTEKLELVVDWRDLDILKQIGKGEFGTVFQAKLLGTHVAVKQIRAASAPTPNADAVKYMNREIAMFQSLSHPHIIQFIGMCEHDGNLYIVTDLGDEGDLRSQLKRTSLELTWAKRLQWAREIASGMAYLHRRQVIFRDLKSKNVLIARGRAKICDFGLARLVEGATAADAASARPHASSVNAAGAMRGKAMTLCGTEEWMAPEVILGMNYGKRADVFSYGIVLLEIVTRKKVRAAIERTPMNSFCLDEAQVRTHVPPDCPPELAQLALQCCEYEPASRPDFVTLVERVTEFEALADAELAEEQRQREAVVKRVEQRRAAEHAQIDLLKQSLAKLESELAELRKKQSVQQQQQKEHQQQQQQQQQQQLLFTQASSSSSSSSSSSLSSSPSIGTPPMHARRAQLSPRGAAAAAAAAAPATSQPVVRLSSGAVADDLLSCLDDDAPSTTSTTTGDGNASASAGAAPAAVSPQLAGGGGGGGGGGPQPTNASVSTGLPSVSPRRSPDMSPRRQRTRENVTSPPRMRSEGVALPPVSMSLSDGNAAGQRRSVSPRGSAITLNCGSNSGGGGGGGGLGGGSGGGGGSSSGGGGSSSSTDGDASPRDDGTGGTGGSGSGVGGWVSPRGSDGSGIRNKGSRMLRSVTEKRADTRVGATLVQGDGAKEGWVRKSNLQSNGHFKQPGKLRWIVVQASTLAWYADEAKRQHIKNAGIGQGWRMTQSVQSQTQLVLRKGNNKAYMFEFENAETTLAWLRVFELNGVERVLDVRTA